MPNNELCIDLHTHTTASDGKLSAIDLLALAQKNGTKILAITDHDTTAGYTSVKEQAVDYVDWLVSGVEVSTTWQGMGLHIVGLNFDSSHEAIVNLLAHQAKARVSRCKIILKKLQSHGVTISYDELISMVGHSHIGRPHIAQCMVQKGFVKSMNQAFKKYLGAGKVGDIKNQWAELPDVITAINQSGGFAVIAHPNHYKMTRSKLLRLVDDFVDYGGKGIEVISGKQSQQITEKYVRIANEKCLLASVGSDFHQTLSYGVSVGKTSMLPTDVTPIWSQFNRDE